MLKRSFVLTALAASILNAQSPVELLKSAAAYYSGLNTLDIKGQASAKLAGTSWQVTYDVETAGVQPQFLPIGFRESALQWTSATDNFHTSRIVPGGTDDFPSRRFNMQPFGFFTDLARNLLDAKRVGSEKITYRGHEYTCDIIQAVYDESPEFNPHSKSSRAKIYIDPKTLWVLKETQPDESVGEWTFTVTSMAFNEAPSDILVKSLEHAASEPKTRSEWVGRTVPEITLTDLSGKRVNLATIRGGPLFLDFWGSYCKPCKRATALSQELAEMYKKDGLTVWTVTQDTPNDARSWLNFNHLSVPVLLDSEGAGFTAFDVPGVPAAILIDDRGKVVKYWRGIDDPEEVRSSVDALVQRLRGGRHDTL